MGISRWIILICYYYGHHVVYVGPHRLAQFLKVCARKDGFRSSTDKS